MVFLLAGAIVAVYLVDYMVAIEVPLLLFYWVPVLLAATFARARQVLFLILEAAVFALFRSYQIGVFSHPEYLLRLAAIVITSLIALRLTLDRERKDREMAQVTSDREATLKALPDLLFEITEESRIQEIHSVASESIFPRTLLMGRPFTELIRPEALDSFRQALDQARQQETPAGLSVELQTTHGQRWFELSIAGKGQVPGKRPTYLVLARDVKARHDAEEALRRQIGFYTILSRCNQAIVESSSQQELLQRICQEAVSTGDLMMSWVGLVNPGTDAVDPVAMAGEGSTYLQGIRIATSPGSPYGRGPTAISIREDRPYWCVDFQNDPATLPWQDRASQYGWRSAAALPLHCEGVVVGSMTLYAKITHAFDHEIRMLLQDMARDIDLALDRFAREKREQQARSALQRSEQDYRELTETIHDVIWRLDASSLTIIYVSPSIRGYLGYEPEDLVGQPITNCLHSEGLWWHASLGEFRESQVMLAVSEDQKDFRLDEIAQTHCDGRLIWGEMTTTAVVNSFTEKLEFHCVSRDITLRKQAEAKLEWLSYYDPLTKLPNRNLLDKLLLQAMRTARRENKRVALLIVGIDRFKSIKAATGYASGDLILKETAERLRQRMRDQDLISRISGDEFLLILPGVNGEQAARICSIVQDIIRKPYQIENHSISLTCSVGITLFPDDGDDAQTLIRKADIALSHAKREGRNRYHFFTTDLEDKVQRRLEIANGLRSCLDREEMGLLYQPQIELGTGELIGAEALLRWNHPRLGALSPSEFIPIAETTGEIAKLGEWSLVQALRQIKLWRSQGLKLRSIAVNVSASQFREEQLVRRVIAFLAEEGLPGDSLELELTESVMLQDPEAAINAMACFADEGIKLSIDDFGTGYSSLNYLKRLRVNKLKIDASFVRDIVTNDDSLSIVKAVINLAKTFKMTTLAEGVESDSQLTILKNLGCDQIQGYFYARPLSAQDFAEFYQELAGINLGRPSVEPG